MEDKIDWRDRMAAANKVFWPAAFPVRVKAAWVWRFFAPRAYVQREDGKLVQAMAYDAPTLEGAFESWWRAVVGDLRKRSMLVYWWGDVEIQVSFVVRPNGCSFEPTPNANGALAPMGRWAQLARSTSSPESWAKADANEYNRPDLKKTLASVATAYKAEEYTVTIDKGAMVVPPPLSIEVTEDDQSYRQRLLAKRKHKTGSRDGF